MKNHPINVDVDGLDDGKGMRCIGVATLSYTDTDGNVFYTCLASVSGALCRVQIKITFGTPVPGHCLDDLTPPGYFDGLTRLLESCPTLPDDDEDDIEPL